MRVNTLAKGFVLSVVLVIVAGCASTTPEFPTGEFVDVHGNTITFKADGKTTLREPASATEAASGEYSLDGDTITFSGGFCSGDGVYKWVLDGDELQFDVVSDECSERRASLEAGLTR